MLKRRKNMGRKKQEEKPSEPAIENEEIKVLKAKIESILFCIPEGVTVDLLAHKVNMAGTAAIQWALSELQKDYETKGGLKIFSDDKGVWKFKVPDEHIPIVQEAAEPEFDRAVIETLAYIAWRNGSRQCDVVRVRGNKAYNHIKLLKEREFIESHKSGLSKWLEPTKKFYEYFHLKQGEKLPVPEEVVKAAEEAEKATAAIKIQEAEQIAQQSKMIADLKSGKTEPAETDESDDKEPESEDITPDEEPKEDITPEEEPEESEEPEGEEPEETEEEEYKTNRSNPDNE